MYVDESGDCGLINSPKRYFILTGLVVHEISWQPLLENFINFRKRTKDKFGLKLREEIHAYAFISKPGSLTRIAKHDRLTILRSLADELARNQDVRLINIVVDKLRKPQGYDVFNVAWKALIQRFENTIIHKNFPCASSQSEYGMVFPDNTDNKKLTMLLRQMRRYNPVPSQSVGSYRNLAISRVIEDPYFKNSEDSYFTQAADVSAYLLSQHLEPCTYMKKKSGNNYFNRLDPIFCKAASPRDSQGIVRF